jgi:mannosyl-oligosaccharide glucosidase
MKRNTEHDAPYWRGPIWININYLAVRALNHYSSAEGPYQEKATALYNELRTNIVNNVYRQYVETGYIWEQYNDNTGRGQGSHPFTGWSALTVLMMAEQY